MSRQRPANSLRADLCWQQSDAPRQPPQQQQWQQHQELLDGILEGHLQNRGNVCIAVGQSQQMRGLPAIMQLRPTITFAELAPHSASGLSPIRGWIEWQHYRCRVQVPAMWLAGRCETAVDET